jgi:hypothetical protein
MPKVSKFASGVVKATTSQLNPGPSASQYSPPKRITLFVQATRLRAVILNEETIITGGLGGQFAAHDSIFACIFYVDSPGGGERDGTSCSTRI